MANNGIKSVGERELSSLVSILKQVDNNDSVLWVGVQPIAIEGGKKIWGEYVSEAEFSPYMMPNIIPMAYVSVSSD